MPFPLPSNLTQPVLNWYDYVPVNPIDTVAGFFKIPTFSYSGLVWRGASDMPTQFNFTASRNFTLRANPTKPTSPDFVPVIRWRSGTKVYRWRLWDDDNLHLEAPLYTNQTIRKNFVIEIWSLFGQTTVTNADPITVTTTIRQTVTDFSKIPADYEDAIGTQVTEAAVSVALPAALPIVFPSNAGAFLDNP